jgi:hypothetical protein
LQAGYSESQAAKGWRKVPQAVMQMLPENMKKLIKLGKKTSKDDMRHLVYGRLVANVTEGTDKGAQSAKILGGSRDLNMWTPDQLAGVIVLQAPQFAIDNKADLLSGIVDGLDGEGRPAKLLGGTK